MSETIKKTPLHNWHVENGASMAEFGGYEMPLWYSSSKNEHISVVTNAGLFDTSHMAVLTVSGKDARDLLQLCFTKDLDSCIGRDKSPIVEGRCVYGAFLNEKGGVIDDSIVYKLAENSFMLVVNAGMGAAIAGHLESHRDGRDVAIADLTDLVGKIDIQGPLSAKILSGLLSDPKSAFERMLYFSFKGHFDPSSPLADQVRLTDGTPVLLSRTGYTGEFGFEIYAVPDRVRALWERIIAEGKGRGLVACGLAARDSLRGGAVLPLSHQDIGPWPYLNHPWSFALPYNEDETGFTKKFIGSDALLNVESPEFTYPFVGFDLRKVSIGDPAVVLDSAGDEIGKVLTCVSDMALGRDGDRIYSMASPDKPPDLKIKGLSCGFAKVRRAMKEGEAVVLKDKRRRIEARIASDIRPDRTARRPIDKML